MFDVLELVEKEGLVPDCRDELPDPNDEDAEDRGLTRASFLQDIETKLAIKRGDGYSLWVVDESGTELHVCPFWSQIECWAFMVGWERSRQLP